MDRRIETEMSLRERDYSKREPLPAWEMKLLLGVMLIVLVGFLLTVVRH
jgi:hypothetical protein